MSTLQGDRRQGQQTVLQSSNEMGSPVGPKYGRRYVLEFKCGPDCRKCSREQSKPEICTVFSFRSSGIPVEVEARKMIVYHVLGVGNHTT